MEQSSFYDEDLQLRIFCSIPLGFFYRVFDSILSYFLFERFRNVYFGVMTEKQDVIEDVSAFFSDSRFVCLYILLSFLGLFPLKAFE